MLSPSSVPDLARILGFLGNEQRLNILQVIAREEMFAREISEKVGISRPLVNIYLKQLEREGFVAGTNRISEDPPYLRRYYHALPFEITVDLDLIKSMKEI
jgi:ArsR family transcriptional regulator